MKLFFGIHHFNDPTFKTNSHNSGIRPDAKSTDIIAKGRYLLHNLVFGSVVDVNCSTMRIEHQLLRVVIGRDGGDLVGEGRKWFGLVFLPETLLVGEFIFGLRGLEGL